MALFLHRAAGVTPGETFNFTMHTTGSGSVGTAADTFASALTTLWEGPAGTDGINQYYAPGTSITLATTSEIEQTTGQQLTREDRDLDLDGTATGNALPPQVAIVASFGTSVAQRRGRGRFYLPAPAVNANGADGRMASAATAIFQSALVAFFGAMANGGLTQVIYSRTGHTTLNVDRRSLGDVFDTQRRRRDKLIENRVPITV